MDNNNNQIPIASEFGYTNIDNPLNAKIAELQAVLKYAGLSRADVASKIFAAIVNGVFEATRDTAAKIAECDEDAYGGEARAIRALTLFQILEKL